MRPRLVACWMRFRLPTSVTSKSPAYTAEEKKWLKDNYRDEFHFLRKQKLSIYKEKDREEGRLIARAMMEKESEAINDKDEDEEEETDFLADLEADPVGHVHLGLYTDQNADCAIYRCRNSLTGSSPRSSSTGSRSASDTPVGSSSRTHSRRTRTRTARKVWLLRVL